MADGLPQANKIARQNKREQMRERESKQELVRATVSQCKRERYQRQIKEKKELQRSKGDMELLRNNRQQTDRQTSTLMD